MPIHGSCLCGKITYDAEIPEDASGKPKQTHLCHCRMCRKITGALTSINLDIPAANFHLTSGELKRVRQTHKDEGFEFSIAFCGDCGTPIIALPHIEGYEDVVIIQVGSVDNPETLEAKPAAEINTKHRMPWISPVQGAQQKLAY